MTENRIQREKSFHEDRFSRDAGKRKGARKYYTIMGSINTYYKNLVSRYCSGMRLLEYGCGMGSNSVVWARNGADVTGIDISPKGIEMAEEMATTGGIEARYFVMDAEKTEFKDGSFDIVVGTGILHHLDLNNSYAELARILDADGHAVFIEPLGHNPLINLYRRSTRSMRTEDEHPLTTKDIELANRYFTDVAVEYFYLFSLLAVPFNNTFLFKPLLSILESADRFIMHRLPFTKRYAWMAVLHLRRPRT